MVEQMNFVENLSIYCMYSGNVWQGSLAKLANEQVPPIKLTNLAVHDDNYTAKFFC